MSPSASGSGQHSILSFFHKQQQPPQPPQYAAPPPSSRGQAQPRQQPELSQTAGETAPPPPQAPPLPQQPPLPAAAAAAAAAIAPATTISSPHPSATILPVTEAHIPALRRINALLLPVNYTDGFYTALLDPAVSGLLSRAILWQDEPTAPAKVVGGLVCRLEPSPFDAATGRYSADLAKKAAASAAPPRARALYIQSLVLLAPYRGLGLAAAALEGISAAVAGADHNGNPRAVEWVYAHVWTDNEDGLAWYGRRGFERDTVLERYYWKLRPDSAWVVKRKVGAAAGGQQHRQDAHELPAAVPASVTAAAVNMPGFASAVTPPLPPPSAANGPPPRGGGAAGARPPPPASSLSFQNKRPDVEWNDLPEEMMAAATASKNSSRSDLLAPPSGSSSRSSSTGRKKRDRAYPTAAFGS